MSIQAKKRVSRGVISVVLGLFLLGMMSLFLVGVAQTDTPRYVAPTGSDSGTCSDPGMPCATWTYTLAQADPADTIRVMEGSYTENVTIDKDITIEGDYDSDWNRYPDRDPSRTVLSGGNTDRTITVEGADLIVYLDGFRITDGDATSASSNARFGGGVLVASGATLRGDDLMIDHNVANTGSNSGWGGGLAVRDGAAYLTHTLVLSNTALPSGSGFAYGGGLYAGGQLGSGLAYLQLVDSVISYNVAGDAANVSDAFGGGLALQAADNNFVILDGNTWSYNVARSSNALAGDGFGGAISVDVGDNPATVGISYDTFEYNTANASMGTESTDSSKGGAIFLEGNSTTPNILASLDQLTVTNNVAQYDGQGLSPAQGGGLYAQGADINLQQSRFTNNRAGIATVNDKRGQGGGIYLFGSILYADGLQAYGNMALDGNGSNDPGVDSQGGGLAVHGEAGYIKVLNSIFGDNDVSQTGGNGAGIYIGPDSTADIVYVTIADQDLNSQEGIYAGAVGDPYDVFITNTIVASHTVGIHNQGFNGRVVARYINFFGNIDDTVGSVVGGEGNVSGDPLFAHPAGWDFHIMNGSTAQDVAVEVDPIYWDVDQDLRPEGAGFDIGADEYVMYEPTPTPTFTPTPTETPGTPTPTETPGTPTPTSTPGTPTPTSTPGTPTPTPEDHPVYLPVIEK